MKHPKLLVVVHPGSLCGSLAMYDRWGAAGTRMAIAKEIAEWSGPVAVVTGDFDDELVGKDLGSSIEALAQALKRADFRTYGSPDDKGLHAAAKRIARQFALGAGAAVKVTGAWNDHDGSGCVTCVADSLEALGADVTISDLAPASDTPTEDEEEFEGEDEGESVETPAPMPPLPQKRRASPGRHR